MLAKEGAFQANRLEYAPLMPLCNRRIKSMVHDWYLERWNDAWLKLKTCRNAKYFYPRVIIEKHSW